MGAAQRLTEASQAKSHSRPIPGDSLSMTDTASTQTTSDDSNDKLALSVEHIADDLSFSNEQGNSWYNYRWPDEPTAVGGQQVILADEYDDLGKIIATHKIWIEIEYAETGTQLEEDQL